MFNPQPGEWIAVRDNDKDRWCIAQFIEKVGPTKFKCYRYPGYGSGEYVFWRGKSLDSFNEK